MQCAILLHQLLGPKSVYFQSRFFGVNPRTIESGIPVWVHELAICLVTGLIGFARRIIMHLLAQPATQRTIICLAAQNKSTHFFILLLFWDTLLDIIFQYIFIIHFLQLTRKVHFFTVLKNLSNYLKILYAYLLMKK